MNENISIAEQAFLKQLEQLQEDINKYNERSQTQYKKSMFEQDDQVKDEINKEIKNSHNFLKNAFNKVAQIKDELATAIVVTGEMLHSSTNVSNKKEELEANKIIRNIDIQLEEKDFEPLAIINYYVNNSISPTKSDSLTLAETNLTIAKQFEGKDKNTAKFALLSNSVTPLVVEKNILISSNFKKAYARRDNLNINEKILIAALEKLKEFNNIKDRNESLIFRICNISINRLSKDEMIKTLNNFKETILNKSYIADSLSNSSFLISNTDYISVPAPKTDRNEIFIEFAQKYLEYGLPDPTQSVQNKLDELICTQANKIYSPKIDESKEKQERSFDTSSHLKIK